MINHREIKHPRGLCIPYTNFINNGSGTELLQVRYYWWTLLQWLFTDYYEHDCISNHEPHDYLLNRLFMRRSKKISKLRNTDLFEGNSPVTGEFNAQMASNAENVSIWWRHHAFRFPYPSYVDHFQLWEYYRKMTFMWSTIVAWSVKLRTFKYLGRFYRTTYFSYFDKLYLGVIIGCVGHNIQYCN